MRVLPEVMMQRVVLIAEDRKSEMTVRAVLGNPDCEVVATKEIEVGLELMRKPKVGCLIVDCGIDGLTRQMRHSAAVLGGSGGDPGACGSRLMEHRNRWRARWD